MFKLAKRIATAATVVLAASAPSAAYARFNLNPPAPPAAVSSQTIHHTVTPSAGNTAPSSSQGFQWDDAGIGAAGALILVSIGSGAMTLRRRTDHPLTN